MRQCVYSGPDGEIVNLGGSGCSYLHNTGLSPRSPRRVASSLCGVRGSLIEMKYVTSIEAKGGLMTRRSIHSYD